jgi:Uma2 family endonuclease
MATDVASHDPTLPVLALPPEMHPNVDHLVTEDDAPVDNIFSEKQQRLLPDSLQSSWPGSGGNRPFVAMANVGLFYSNRLPAVVPDFLLSLNVKLPADVRPKWARSYFIWEYGKTPELVVEVVLNRKGGEDSEKLALYAEIGIRYYVIFGPYRQLSEEPLRAYRLRGLSFERLAEPVWFPEVGLGLRLWGGRYEDMDATWLRWVNADGSLVPTGKERAETEQQRAEAERQRADAERERANLLAAQLRQAGIEPHGS